MNTDNANIILKLIRQKKIEYADACFSAGNFLTGNDLTKRLKLYGEIYEKEIKKLIDSLTT